MARIPLRYMENDENDLDEDNQERDQEEKIRYEARRNAGCMSISNPIPNLCCLREFPVDELRVENVGTMPRAVTLALELIRDSEGNI
jgi:hypothetical protein